MARVKSMLSISGSGGLLTSNMDASWLHLRPVQEGEDEVLSSSVFRALCLHGILLVLISCLFSSLGPSPLSQPGALGQPLASSPPSCLHHLLCVLSKPVLALPGLAYSPVSTFCCFPGPGSIGGEGQAQSPFLLSVSAP